MRPLVWTTLLLLVVITATSSYLRLAQAGLACPDRLECYGRMLPPPEPGEESTGVTIARGLHRVAASLAGVLVLLIAALGWKGFGRGERVASAAQVLLAAALAILGGYTPSPLPAVTLGNLLGGFAMIAFGAWLAAALRPRRRTAAARMSRWLRIALAAVAIEAALGGLVAARQAGFACVIAACAGWPEGAAWSILNPFVATAAAADSASLAEPSRQALNIAHRLLAVPVLLLVAWVGARVAVLGSRAAGVSLVVLTSVQITVGLAQVALGLPLAVAFVHTLLAAATLAVLAALLAITHGERE